MPLHSWDETGSLVIGPQDFHCVSSCFDLEPSTRGYESKGRRHGKSPSREVVSVQLQCSGNSLTAIILLGALPEERR
jgi:hypothetical protein